MSRPAVVCPGGCGSTSFRASRRAVIVEEFSIDEGGEVRIGEVMAEGGGPLRVTCDGCGRKWTSRSRHPEIEGMARRVETWA